MSTFLYSVQLSTAQLEPPEEQRRRFEIECEFVQALANPHYVNCRALKYPQCLHILECLQCNNFREALTSGANAKFIEDQQVLQWLYYLRKRQRLHVNPEAAEDAGERSQEDTDDDTDGDKTGSDIN
ncbi:SOH1 protein [Teladorsagia circumcincta]|uniref:Mediator of RNA polymerase II transcription subunit 31 n=1 Tax=Teladorsagia circumcincta TaxID=45464 RepID=A0A2G9UDJ9_TELCI|nr:SOH1 protein [Teladorsagia circumcincta]